MITVIRILAWAVALGMLMLPVLGVLNGWMLQDRWPMRRLEVTAEFQHVSAEQIRTAVASRVGRGYFDTDPAAIRSALAGLPWVEDVRVRKRWPDRIEVMLVEHRARAHWGRDQLLSDRGVLFTTPGASNLQGLPRLVGPDERMSEVLAFHDAAQQQLSGIGLTVGGTRLSRRGSWTLVLADGSSIVIGRHADAKARLSRLVRVLPQLLQGERRPFARIDLRYTNGFAIEWAEPGSDAAPAESDPGSVKTKGSGPHEATVFTHSPIPPFRHST